MVRQRYKTLYLNQKEVSEDLRYLLIGTQDLLRRYQTALSAFCKLYVFPKLEAGILQLPSHEFVSFRAFLQSNLRINYPVDAFPISTLSFNGREVTEDQAIFDK